MHDLPGFGGLTELASPGDNLTEKLQQPFCPVPERIEQTPLFGYRWRAHLTAGQGVVNNPPEVFVLWKTIEYRIPGAGSYEVTLREDVAWLAASDDIPVGTPLPLVEANSGLLRFRVTSGGHNAGRLHSGHSTLVVNGEYCNVDILVPARAVNFELVPVPPVTGVNIFSTSVTFARGSVRILALPARSRKPSQWRTADFVTVVDSLTFPQIILNRGVSDIKAIGTRQQSISLDLFATATGGGPAVQIIAAGGSTLAEDTWVPVDGTPVLAPAFQETGTFVLYQRGFV